MIHLVTIRKLRVKDKVTIDQLTELANIVGGDDWLDYGFHNTGRYSQLHFHGLLLGFHPYIPWINGFDIHYKRVRFGAALNKYLHKDDYACSERLKNILIQNDYRYNYYPYD